MNLPSAPSTCTRTSAAAATSASVADDVAAALTLSTVARCLSGESGFSVAAIELTRLVCVSTAGTASA